MKNTKQSEALESLRETLKPGDKVYTILRSVSRSGRSRVIDLKTIDKEGVPLHIGGLVSIALGYRFDDRHQGVKVSGCGMDMGYHVVYNLAHALWPDGVPCSGKGCPSNDHSNGDRNYDEHMHSDGGYALRHQWL